MEIEVYARLRGNLDALDQSSAVMGTDILDVQDNVVAVGPEPRRVAVAFNAVLSDSASTEDVFECVASPLLWAFLDGQNAGRYRDSRLLFSPVGCSTHKLSP